MELSRKENDRVFSSQKVLFSEKKERVMSDWIHSSSIESMGKSLSNIMTITSKNTKQQLQNDQNRLEINGSNYLKGVSKLHSPLKEILNSSEYTPSKQQNNKSPNETQLREIIKYSKQYGFKDIFCVNDQNNQSGNEEQKKQNSDTVEKTHQNEDYYQQKKITSKNIDIFSGKTLMSVLLHPRGKGWQFLSGVSCIPHPDKVSYNGEDSCFTSKKLLCVADGVGGNRYNGNDPAKYSRELTQLINQLYVMERKYKNQLDQLVEHAYSLITNGGSSTLLLIELDENTQTINTYQIGDSLFMILRKQYDKITTTHSCSIITKSPEMQIRFNCPFQVCSQNGLPTPRKENIQIQENDLILLGSDGLFDNLTNEEILDVVNRHWTHSYIKDMNRLASELASSAYYMSLQREVNVPFVLKANQLKNRQVFKGGKKDDISVICSRIIK